jgi:hypothetical protein
MTRPPPPARRGTRPPPPSPPQVRPPPPQVLRPPLVADEDQVLLPEKVEATYSIQPPFIEERDKIQVEAEALEQQRARNREKAAEKRRRDSQLTKEALTAIDELRGRYRDANNTDIAKWLQRKRATRVFYQKKGRRKRYTVEALARKISREHPRK